MSTFRTILLGTLVALTLGVTAAGYAAVTYDAVLEWTGPYFKVVNNASVGQMVDNPLKDVSFLLPYGVAAREHTTGQRDVVYVVDTGHNRVQTFEVNASYLSDNTFTWQAGGVAAANDFDDNQIYLNEWAAGATRFILPHSESVVINGVRWGWVASLTGFTAADKVYTISYADATNSPEILFPSNSLTSTSTIRLRYALSDNYTGAADAFGLGDVDYGTGSGATPVLTKIDETSGGPTSWQQVRAIALIPNEAAATSDDIFLLDSADNSTNQNEELFYYTVTAGGIVSYAEAYDDILTSANGVAVANGGPTEVAGAVTVSDDLGPFDQATAAVYDASQITGHTYTVTVAAGNVTITDATTGRILVDAAAFADLADPFLGIPGLTLPLNGAVGVSNTIATTQAVTDRFLFVADTGGNRIKVVSSSDDTQTATNDWLPGDAHTMAAQPTGAGTVGATADEDYRYTTPATVPQDYTVWTNAFPVKEGTLSTITFDPDGTPATWTKVDDLATAGPLSTVYTVDWTNGKIGFGDGVHGQIPPASTAFSFTYSTTPDVIRYGYSGTASSRFSSPRGIASRWNSQIGAYDVYVADSGNGRIQKFAFYPAQPSLGQPARMDYVCQWNTATTSTDYLNNPVSIAVALDNQTLGTSQTCWIVVSDQGNNRLVTYKDTAAMTGGGTTVPTFDSRSGSRGNSLGQYAQPEGVTFLANGNNLDLYVCDSRRGLVAKYEEAPTPSVVFNLGGAFSPNPQCFRPTGSYTFNVTIQNPPSDGYVDYYYDSVSTFSETTAKLCIASRTIPATATSATWVFSTTPGGLPSDNVVGYYVFAVLKDGNGSTLSTASGGSTNLFCLDSTLVPTLQLSDEIDGDRTLSLQNNTERVVDLQISYPESTVTVGFSGTFDKTLYTIVGITPGNGWEGTGFTNLIFNPSYDNTTGTFLVSTSVTGAPTGLNGNGPFTLARVLLKAQPSAIDLVNRFKTSSMAMVTGSSGINDINGAEPISWKTKNMNVRCGYLGDLATQGSGADSTYPHKALKPDGRISFDDQMVFTLGWNGVDGVQDRIADIGPTQGSMPDLQSVPDGILNVDDLLAFTVMYSWAAGLGYQRALPGADQGLALNRVYDERPVTLGLDVEGGAMAYTVSRLETPKKGDLMTVDLVVDRVQKLAGAYLNLGFDASKFELVGVENGGFLNGKSGSLFFNRSGDGWVEISASRLDQEKPWVDGSGTVARLTFSILDENAGAFDLKYDLRSSEGTVLARGDRPAGPFSGTPVSFQLYSNYPNPVTSHTNIIFSLPTASDVSLSIFDVSGRVLRSLVSGKLESGYHVVGFDGRDDRGAQISTGVYFYRLQAAGNETTRKMILSR